MPLNWIKDVIITSAVATPFLTVADVVTMASAESGVLEIAPFAAKSLLFGAGSVCLMSWFSALQKKDRVSWKNLDKRDAIQVAGNTVGFIATVTGIAVGSAPALWLAAVGTALGTLSTFGLRDEKTVLKNLLKKLKKKKQYFALQEKVK